ncbi:prostate and testis expressed protein 3-like [Hemicordylus capensis]|uniref:prostate and testis expressed protein 3-like n=1 Tax=Hemicordylus capensis TaxID=884348 RepID=UPI0023045442|nr:prostate and testis expressed protein 3-like [Hemicordylus capensis]
MDFFPRLAYGLKCQYCKEEKAEGCKYPVNVCYPKYNGVCLSVSVYHGGTLKFRMEGCTNIPANCRKNYKKRDGTTWKSRCCSTDLCNHRKNDI